jgi:hypothetical protein
MIKGFKPKTREDLLALYVAQSLEDIKSLPFYLSCTESYPEDSIRKALNAVRKEAILKIKSRRSTFFKYLLQINGKKTHDHFGD